MKQRAVVLLAACAVLFSAGQASAQTPGTCADWQGTWALTYDKANASKNGNIIITDICSKPSPSSATPACMPTGSVQDSWLCVARGKRVSDNQTVQIRQIAMDTANFGFYESTDAEILAGGQNTPYDSIASDNFTKCAFKANAANLGLASGEKDNCTDTPIEDNCTLEKIIPGTISKLSAVLSPIKPFVIIGSGDPGFARGDRAVFDTDAIKPLIQ